MNSYYGYRGFDGSDFMAVIGMVLGFIAVFAIIAWAMSLVLYILRSIGLYKLSENRGMSGAGLAWIPIIGYYRIGSIADDIVARNGGRSYYRHILLIGGIINFINVITSWSLTALGSPIFSQFFNGNYRLPYDYGYNYYYDGFFAYWGVSAILSVLSIAVLVFTIIALNKIYKCYRPISSTTWTVLSVIFPFMQSIFPFVIRNAAPVSEWGAQGYYPQQNTMQNPNWQAPPPQYPTYDRQPPVNGGYPPQNQGWAQPPSSMDNSYQPPIAPNSPEPWEIEDVAAQQPPQTPWEKNGNGDS